MFRDPRSETGDTPRALTASQIERFHRQGYIGPLPRYAPMALLDEVSDLLMRVENDKLEHPLYGRFSPRDWHLVDARLLALLTHPALVEPLRHLMGDDLLLWRSKAFIKPPRGEEIGWHQEWGPFDGAEFGNDIPSLQPAGDPAAPWNISIWIALDDITPDMGPIRFLPASHVHHYPVAQVPLPESAFFEDPFADTVDPREIVRRAVTRTLILDVDTRDYFDGVDVERLTSLEAQRIVLERLGEMTGEVMLADGVDFTRAVSLPMQKGEFVIFYERTLHGSDANATDRYRPAVNCRVTPGNTLVYPQRLDGQFMDGAFVDIRRHACVRLSGAQHHPDNVYSPLETPAEV